MRFETEEIELFITIAKNYLAQERKALRKLQAVECKLEARVAKYEVA